MKKNNEIAALVNRVTEGDCIEGMQRLPDGCVNLIIADPPYNLDKDFGIWKEKNHRSTWLSWSKAWLDECNRVLAPGGNIFVYGIHNHICWIQCYLFELELTYRRQIIWYYENGFSGFNERSLAAHYEPLLWFSKGDNYVYNPIREPYKSAERLKHKITKNGKTWVPHPDGRLAGDIWNFPTLAGRRFRDEKVKHPTQKPLSISERIVKHFSNDGQLILIPFGGSGTECLAAKMYGRDFISFELNSDYIQITNSRIDDWVNQQKGMLHFEVSATP